MTSSLAVFEAVTQVKSTHLIKSCFKTRKKIQYGNKRNFYTNLRLIDRLNIVFTACLGELMPEEVLTSVTVSDAYR